MGYELKLAWRYFRSRRSGLARFTKTVAIIGIAAGVASLILAQALASGFESEMREKILGNTAHVAVFRMDGAEIENWKDVKTAVADIGNISKTSPTTYESAIIIGEKNTSYAVLRAIEDKTSGEAQISLGQELAEKIGATEGDTVEIITTGQKEFLPLNSKAIVRNTFRTGLYDYDSAWVYVSFEEMAKLMGKPTFSPTALSLQLNNVYDADKTAQAIRERLSPEFRVIQWQEANRPLFAALTLERKVVLAIISLIIFIAALNITTTLALLVNERRMDIAVLRTNGAQAKSIVSVFVLEGLITGGIGCLLGMIAGIAGCSLANYFKLIRLPEDVYSIGFVPLKMQLQDVLLIALFVIALAFLATVYPAFTSSKIKPLENLRKQ